MPAYNFAARFAPFVKSGFKRQTIRKRRKRGNPVPGDRLIFYTGQRTKSCKKLGEARCANVQTIRVDRERITIDVREINRDEKKQLAVSDGFDDLDEFLRWFDEHYGLPFEGLLIKW